MFSLAKVFKNVKNKSRFSMIQKIMHNSISIQARRTKINNQVFPYLLNNFTYAPFTCLDWPKCSNYVVNVKNKSRFSIIQKKIITQYSFKLDEQKLILNYFNTC